MKKLCLLFLSAASLAVSGCAESVRSDICVKGLRCEYLVNPAGIDVTGPRLSWVLDSSQRGQRQTAYQICVAGSKDGLSQSKGDLWSTGKVGSDQSAQVVYKGKPLMSRAQCWWKVRVWDGKGRPGEWSEPECWTMGLLEESDWSAKWIGLDRPIGQDDPNTEFRRLSARMLRKEFHLDKKINKATAYVCGLGLFEMYLNGQKIGDAVLSPALTQYLKRSFYMTFDVTEQLNQGRNAVGVILGNGRYFAPRVKVPFKTQTFGFPKLLVQIEVEYADGTSARIVSDQTWRVTADGPVTENNEYDGEKYDARREMTGWAKAGFDDSAWMDVELVKRPSEKISAQMIEPIRVTQTIQPVKVTQPKAGLYVFDMGQNIVGWVRLKVKGQKGTAVKLRFAEVLKDDGTLYLDNIRSAKVTDIYTLKGEGDEVWEPRFTYHGFRYVEMTGLPGEPDTGTIEGRVVHDDLEQTGTFECSNEMINRIYKNAVWGIRGNYRSLPTDCPQRDERQGWLGDRATGSRGESYIFDIVKLYGKWIQDIQDAQLDNGSIPDVCPSYWPMYRELGKGYGDNATWSGSYIILVGMLYDQFGDTEVIRNHYLTMKKWLERMSQRYLKDGILTRDIYGDWCVPPEKPKLIHSVDPNRQTNGAYLGTTFFYYETRLMERYARLLGEKGDAKRFAEQAETLKKAFNKKFFNEKSVTYSNDSATANVLALAFDLAPAKYRKQIFGNLVAKIEGRHAGHIPCGLVGMQFLMRTLTENGRADIAYRFATEKTYPSWGYMVEKGATTIWELWNGDTADPAMNSLNHVMLLGDFNIWLYENLAGLKPDAERPGFRHIIMKPTIVGDLKFVKASHKSIYGVVKSEWQVRNGRFEWAVLVPANTTATVYIPTSEPKTVTEGGVAISKAQGVKFLRSEDGRVVFEIGSGQYKFDSEL